MDRFDKVVVTVSTTLVVAMIWWLPLMAPFYGDSADYYRGFSFLLAGTFTVLLIGVLRTFWTGR